MSRILYVSHTHPPDGSILDNVGGMQRVSYQLINELKSNEEVHIEKETINASGEGWIGIITFFFLIKLLFRLPARVRKCEADAIVFSSMVTASLAYFIRNRINIPMVTINHGRDVTLPNNLYQNFVPKIFDNLDGVISVSNATREECIKRGMKPEKGVALPNGFNLEKFRDFPDKKESRLFFKEQHGIAANDKPILLTVGRLVKRKGHEWFVRNVLPKISSNVMWIVIGDGPQMKNLEKAVMECSYKSRVFLLGQQPDKVLKKAYAAADLFIMPNIPVEGDMEGFGIVLLEAAMANTPAVASDLEGIKDVITDGKNGYKVPVNDAERFSKKIDELLSGDLEDMSERARQHVKAQFSWKNVSEKYLSYIKKVINRS